MKKKTFYRILNLVMALVLIFTAVNIRPDIAHAQDPVPGILDLPIEENPGVDPAGSTEEPPEVLTQDPAAPEQPQEEPPEVPSQDPSAPGEIEIEASARIISFGEVEQGSAVVDYKGVTITNTGRLSTYINYQMSNGEEFELNAPGPMSLAPGQSTTIYVKLKSDNPEGDYAAKLIIVPDDMIAKTINIGITGRIVVKRPYITYMGVNPGNVTLSKGSSYSFKADVRGENNPDTRVNWSVQGNTSAATKIDNNGNLVVGNDEGAKSFQVVIKSVQDPDVWEFGIVNVEEGSYSVTTRSNPVNGGTTAGGKSVKSGSDIELVAAPSNGYKFVNWTVDGKPVSNDQKFVLKNITKNTEAVANFSQTNCYVKVKANHPEGGIVSDSVNVLYGADATITAKANGGFVFEGWYENNKKISGDAKFVVKGITTNREITANFVKNTCSITTQVYPEQSGAVFGGGNYALGSKVTLTAQPLSGYVFDGWAYNNNVIGRDSTLVLDKVSQDYAIVAVFKKNGAKVYQINSTVAEGKGAIAPAGNNGITEGQTITYTFAPSTGYLISSVIVDGVNIGAVTSYTFDKVNQAHNISVKFAKLPESNTNTTASTPAKKQDTAAVKNVKEQVANQVESVIEKPDANASEVLGENSNAEAVDANSVVDFYAYAYATGILQEMDMSEDVARELIRTKNDRELLERAAQSQYLAVSVNNDYSSVAKETEYVSYFDVASIPNLEDVVDSVLTEDEKMSCFAGNPISVNMNIFANNEFQTDDDKEMLNIALKNHMSVGNFFEAVFMKSDSGRTENITELTVPMQIVLEIPANIKAEGREYYILRAHKNADGTTAFDFLANQSTDSDKIVFTTDKFSSYAICYRGGKSQGTNFMTVINFIVISTLVLALLVVSVVTTLTVRRMKRRKARRTHNHRM